MGFGYIIVNIMFYTAKLGYVEEVYFVNMLQGKNLLFDMIYIKMKKSAFDDLDRNKILAPDLFQQTAHVAS